MTVSAENTLSKSLSEIVVPGVDRPLADVGRVSVASIDGERAQVDILLGFPAAGLFAELEARIRAAILDEYGPRKIEVRIVTKVTAHGVQRNLKPLPNVSNIVAIASGKGGVGKSTTAVNLALALSGEGAKVGVLDADIYGPSIPLMLGVSGEKPTSADGQSMTPPVAHGMQVMSIGFLIDPDQPMVWRGPMVTQALNQMLQQTRWSELDYLIVDMPPGTGDIQLTLSQQVPVSGAVIVTTPQDIALLDARKGLQMFRKVNVPVLGIIENMSTHICTNCGHEEHLFGSGGGAQMALDYDVDLLGQIPLDLRIRQQTDGGLPSVIAEPNEGPAQAYRRTAQRLAARLAMQGRDYSARFPRIVVEDT
ncbi:MAG: iron-sulfur cluster carrier protein ApbC [Proteobacteria bacterium]|nr:iron-sulfur cluster carrier protein ApbC [Pseudomonadota bacterium]MDA0992915.1 iron-sulfur cluster carrier protein ApbC [Pseudomonadota bacterium]